MLYCVFHSISIKVEAAHSLYSRAGNSAESVVTINNPRCLHSVFYLAPALPAPFCAARPGVIGGSKKTTNKNMNIFIFGGLWSKTRGGQILVNMAMAMSSQASPQSSPTFNRCCIFVQSSPYSAGFQLEIFLRECFISDIIYLDVLNGCLYKDLPICPT